LDPRDRVVQCAEHGESRATFICGHLVRGTGLGFFSAEDPDNPRPDAWCGACERLRVQHGGEWPEEVESTLGVTLQCAECYDRVRARNALPGS
jgi:hypothetical protein